MPRSPISKSTQKMGSRRVLVCDKCAVISILMLQLYCHIVYVCVNVCIVFYLLWMPKPNKSNHYSGGGGGGRDTISNS